MKRVSSSALVRNVAFPRAVMSFSTATEASNASKSYGSEQIQVLTASLDFRLALLVLV